MSLSRVFNIATSGLMAYQQALDVTANNIANASNPDYTLERADLTSAAPTSDNSFSWGNGVQLQDIQRVRDTLTDQQIRSNNSSYSDNNERSVILGNVQSLFSEPSDSGLSNLTTAFFNSWQQLSVTPNSVSLRNNVIQAAQSLGNKIQSVNDGITSVNTDITGEVNGDINTINSDLKQIQTLNVQIFSASTMGQQANTLMDNRDKLIDDLSNLANINVTYDQGGSAVITMGGLLAVDRLTCTQLSASTVNGKISIQNSEGKSLSSLSGGELYALTDLYNNTIPGYQSSLKNFVNRIITSVNAQHSTGYTINDPPLTGINFFNTSTDGTLTINQQILQDPDKIAVSSDGTVGNGDIAANIAGLINQQDAAGATLMDNYSTLVAQVGSDDQFATDTSQNDQLLLNQLQTQKSSASGVSVDEEMSNVLQYQRSYEASAKLVSVADEMLQTLITMVT